MTIVGKHLSLRIQALPGEDPNPTLNKLGIAIYMILDLGGRGRLDDMKEYGHAILISREKIEELFETGRLFVYEGDFTDIAARFLKEGEEFPKTEVEPEKI